MFEADAFDAFNRFIPGSPTVSNINSSNFGEISGQDNSPRTFQLAGQINF
jgi:hypothetical protein